MGWVEASDARQQKRRRQDAGSWLASLFSFVGEERTPRVWQEPLHWEVASDDGFGRRRSQIFTRASEPFVLETTRPTRSGEGRLGLYLRYLGDADRVCVRFRLSMMSGTAGGPQQAWRSPVVTFGRHARKGAHGLVVTNWGNGTFAVPEEFHVSVRCDIAILERPTQNALLAAAHHHAHHQKAENIGSGAAPVHGNDAAGPLPPFPTTGLCAV